MKLNLQVEYMKDATGVKKRVMSVTLRTDIDGLDRIDAVTELDEGTSMSAEIDQLIENMLALKNEDIKNNKPKEYEKRDVSKKDGRNKAGSDK